MEPFRPIRQCQPSFSLREGLPHQPFGRLTLKLTTLVTALFFFTGAEALTLPDLLRAASDTHPTIQAARQGINAANEDLDAAQRQYWPTFSASVESGPTNSTEAPARLLRAEQTLWDFGRTKANVSVSERSVDVASAALEAQRQTIGLQVIDAWRTLQASYGRINVSQNMLKQLASHESMMLRRVAGELSTQIDLDLVRSRILQGRVELTQAQTSVQVSITRLQNLTGLQNLETALSTPPPLPSRADLDKQSQLLNQVDWDAAANRQPAVTRAIEEMHVGNERINAKAAESRPQIYARLDQTINGRKDTGAYIGVRYTPGAGFSTWVEARALAARALALEESAQAARIEARQTLDLDRDDLRDNGVRAQALDLAVQGAQRVFESYERQFTAGRKSWIDLMNAVREVAQNAYTLVDTRAAQASALYRLQLRVDPEMIGVPVDLSLESTPGGDGTKPGSKVVDAPAEIASSRAEIVSETTPVLKPADLHVEVLPAMADSAAEAPPALPPVSSLSEAPIEVTQSRDEVQAEAIPSLRVARSISWPTSAQVQAAIASP